MSGRALAEGDGLETGPGPDPRCQILVDHLGELAGAAVMPSACRRAKAMATGCMVAKAAWSPPHI